MITQIGFFDALSMWCDKHESIEPVLFEGQPAFSIDVLTHLDMLIAHRKKYEKKE